MRIQKIIKKNSDKLIVFMNGWGMDNSIVSHLIMPECDFVSVCDYTNPEFDFSEFNLDKYSKKILIAWSMGVYVSNLFYDFFENFNKKIAIAGTNKIIDNNFGIPQKIYNYTVKFFNDESAQKFINSMFQKDVKIKLNRTTDELKEELISIQKLNINSEINFNKVIIPKNDVIVPYKNQMKYWENKNAELCVIDSAHYVFDNYESWQDIIC